MKRTNHWSPIINKDKRQFASWVIDCQELFIKQFGKEFYNEQRWLKTDFEHMIFVPDYTKGAMFAVCLNDSYNTECETLDESYDTWVKACLTLLSNKYSFGVQISCDGEQNQKFFELLKSCNLA